jgi:hypothetical protein
MNKPLAIFACIGLLALSAGCGPKKVSDQELVGSYVKSRMSQYTEETPKAILEGCGYISAAIIFAALIRGILNK